MLYHERGQAPGHPGGLLSCLGWNLLLTAASSCLSEPRLGQAGKQRQRPGGRTPSLERQHQQHALACERRRRGWVWMSTSSSDSVESQSRFPDVLWTQPNKRKRDRNSRAKTACSYNIMETFLTPHKRGLWSSKTSSLTHIIWLLVGPVGNMENTGIRPKKQFIGAIQETLFY